MVAPLELGLLALVLVLVFGAYRLIQAVKPLIVNAVVGLVVLLLAKFLLGIQIGIGPVAVLVVAFGGVPGALLVILLAMLRVAFVPGLLVPPLG